MSDELTSRLKELAQEGETPPPLSGAGIRLRAVRRRRRRRASGAVAGVCAATALVLALNLGGGGGQDHPDHSPRPAASPTGTPTVPAAPDATVDLSRRALTVAGRTLPLSAGYAKTPTTSGRMTVTAKEASKVVPAADIGLVGKDYTLKLPWVIELASVDGTSSTYIAALTYDDKAPGAYDRTNGWIGLRPTDAKWLYAQLRLGAVVDIEGATPSVTPSADGSMEGWGDTGGSGQG